MSKAFSIAPGARVFAASKPISMGCGFPKLTEFAEKIGKPRHGDLYLFYNKNGNYVKVLYWNLDGFCLWAKKLEKPLKFAVGDISPNMKLAELSSLVDRVIKYGVKKSAPPMKVAANG